MAQNTSIEQAIPAPHLKSENLSERVVLWIKQSILDGVFTAGSILPSEQELCTLLGVGKSSIREALKMLQMIGIVEIQQGKRTRICDTIKPNVMTPVIFYLILDKASSQQLFDFRVMFETAVSNFAMEHATEEGIQRLADTAARYQQLSRENRATIEDEFAFHQTLYEICENPYILQIGTLLLDLFKGPMKRSNMHDSARDTIEHTEIVKALVQKDQTILNHALENSFEIYRKMLDLA